MRALRDAMSGAHVDASVLPPLQLTPSAWLTTHAPLRPRPLFHQPDLEEEQQQTSVDADQTSLLPLPLMLQPLSLDQAVLALRLHPSLLCDTARIHHDKLAHHV
jgi:hypothetical protein